MVSMPAAKSWKWMLLWAALLSAGSAGVGSAQAQGASASKEAAVKEATAQGAAAPLTPQQEIEKALEAAAGAVKAGPMDIPLGEQGVLKLPQSFGFVPAYEAGQLLQAMGNRTAPGLQGMIVPVGRPNEDWFMVVNFAKTGYIKDDDAKEWNADDLLNSIREGTEATNEERRKRGIAEMEVVGWVEKPLYQAQDHRLVWSMSSKDKGAPAVSGVNYNTLALGREGYVSMNLVTDINAVEKLKPVAQTLLASLNFNQGKRYEDFDEKTDKMAEYGLATIVAGVAAKKLGLFALIGAFLLKFAKVIGVAVLAGGAIVAKIFKGRKKEGEQGGQT